MDIIIDNITWINQNMQIPSSVAADFRAREIEKAEIKKIEAQEKEDKVEDVDNVDEVEKVLPVESAKEIINKDTKHFDVYV